MMYTMEYWRLVHDVETIYYNKWRETGSEYWMNMMFIMQDEMFVTETALQKKGK